MAFYLLKFTPRFVYSAVQRRITGRFFFTVSDPEYAAYNYHVSNFRRLRLPARALEFGAGSHLLTSLLLSAAGATEVLAYDIAPIATVEQVNHVIRQLDARGVPGEWREFSNLQDLLRFYRIRYCAPGDAANTGLPNCSIDFFCSTSTLEHIPISDIERILTECNRIATPQALWSHIIDYHDHYASADPSITRFNFYRYSSRLWGLFNPSSHFQNRLRHSDFLKLFALHELNAVEAKAIAGPGPIPFSPHPNFSRFSLEDLLALNGMFLLKKAAPSADQPRSQTIDS